MLGVLKGLLFPIHLQFLIGFFFKLQFFCCIRKVCRESSACSAGSELCKAYTQVVEYHLTIVSQNLNTFGVLPIGKVIILKTC